MKSSAVRIAFITRDLGLIMKATAQGHECVNANGIEEAYEQWAFATRYTAATASASVTINVMAPLGFRPPVNPYTAETRGTTTPRRGTRERWAAQSSARGRGQPSSPMQLQITAPSYPRALAYLRHLLQP